MTITDYLMNIGLIVLVVLQIRGHKVTRARLVFPLVATVFVAAQFSTPSRPPATTWC